MDLNQELNQSHSSVKNMGQGDLISSALWSTTQDTSTGQISLAYIYLHTELAYRKMRAFINLIASYLFLLLVLGVFDDGLCVV